VTSAVDGLVSGMNTTQVISQLMQVEAMPQQQLQQKVATENKLVSGYQSVNTKLAALQTAAKALTDTSTTGIWSAVTAASSSTSVAATASNGAAPGTFTFDVTALSTAQMSTTLVGTGPVTSGAGLDVTVSGNTIHLTVTTDTAQGVADAVNKAGLGVKANVVTTDQGTVIQFVGTKTGAGNSFTVTGLAAGTPTVVTAAADAQIKVGNPAAGGYTVSSASNTFTGVVPNVTLTVSKVESGVAVATTSNENAIADKVQTLVDAYNAAHAEIGKQTAYDPANKVGGPLGGEFAVRRIDDNLLDAFSNGQGGYGSFTQLGLTSDNDGKLSFDRAMFLTAYEADPAKTQSALTAAGGTGTGGLAAQLVTVTTNATDSTTGSITLALQGANSTVTDLNARISDWDVRLQDRRDALQRQFSALEVALGKLKDQSSWLSGQIASLS
jgi:flagellar hook-associated protein 2